MVKFQHIFSVSLDDLKRKSDADIVEQLKADLPGIVQNMKEVYE